MTHPDDELSILAWMRRLAEAGNEVHVAWTHSTPRREVESRAVMSEVGIPGDRLHFFDAPDGRVVDHLEEFLPLFRNLACDILPDRVACGAFEQGHIDHDATNYLVSRAYDGPIFEIPFYHPYSRRAMFLNRFARPDGEEVIRLTGEESRFKRHMASRYPSQRIHSILVAYELVTTALLRPAKLDKTERMRLQPRIDYTVPNLPEPYRSQVLQTPTWSRWSAAMERVALPAPVDVRLGVL